MLHSKKSVQKDATVLCLILIIGQIFWQLANKSAYTLRVLKSTINKIFCTVNYEQPSWHKYHFLLMFQISHFFSYSALRFNRTDTTIGWRENLRLVSQQWRLKLYCGCSDVNETRWCLFGWASARSHIFTTGERLWWNDILCDTHTIWWEIHYVTPGQHAHVTVSMC